VASGPETAIKLVEFFSPTKAPPASKSCRPSLLTFVVNYLLRDCPSLLSTDLSSSPEKLSHLKMLFQGTILALLASVSLVAAFPGNPNPPKSTCSAGKLFSYGSASKRY
jgi:hypothetical protein